MRETYTEPEDKITPREGRGSESLNVILHLPRELKVSTDEKSVCAFVCVRAKNLRPLAWLGQEKPSSLRREFW